MSGYSNLIIQALDSHHDRSGFGCGIDVLDGYLHKQANQDTKRRISRVFVAVTPEDVNTIVGYYTLSTLSLELSLLPQSIVRKLPRHPIPAALLGRLAVKREAQGHGVGRMLLVDALKRTLAIGDEIAIYALVVDAIDARAQGFYEQFGFVPLDAESRRLFLPLQSMAL